VCGLDASGSGYAPVMDPCEHDLNNACNWTTC